MKYNAINTNIKENKTEDTVNLYLSNNSGILEVVTGSMFSGKSEELIRRVRRAKYAKQKTIVFKHAIDKRYDDVNVVSHSKDRIEAVPAMDVQIMYEYMEKNPDTQVIGVDETQFFGNEIVDFCKKYVKLGKRVIVAGLDMNFRGEPFEPMPELMSIADYVDKFHAICTICGNPAYATQRIINGEPAYYDDPVVLIGAEENYEARCRRHHEIKYRDKNESKIYFIVGTGIDSGKKYVEEKYINEFSIGKTIKIDNVNSNLNVTELRDYIKSSADENETLLVRVVGGVLHPLKEKYSFLDLMIEYRKEAEVVLVTENKEGILNSLYLTIEVLGRSNIHIKEIFYVNKKGYSPEKIENIEKVYAFTGIPYKITEDI